MLKNLIALGYRKILIIGNDRIERIGLVMHRRREDALTHNFHPFSKRDYPQERSDNPARTDLTRSTPV